MIEAIIYVLIITLFVIAISVYISFELLSMYYTKCSILQVIIVSAFLEKRLNRIIPPWWSPKESSQFSSINRPFLKYRVWVEFESLGENKQDVQGWVLLDRLGRIENRSELNRSFSMKDSNIPEETIKKYRRDKLLNDLNI